MSLSRLLENYIEWWPLLWNGLTVTVMLTFVSMAIALIIGLGLALARLRYRHAWLRVPATVFVEIIRGSPLLLQLFYIYYVLPFFGVRFSAIEAGILGLAINYGAYLSEVIRAGIEAVDNGQWEAALVLGLSPFDRMRWVILPQALRIVIPPIGNYFVSLFKDTALVSTISIGELLFKGQTLASQNFQYLQIYSLIFVIYLAISFPASRGVILLERRMRIVGRSIA